MRLFVDGVEGNSITMYKGEDASHKVMLLNDDGSLVDVTGDTVTLIVYDTADRRNTAIFTVTLTLTTPTAGFMTATVPNASTALLVPGQNYYAYVKMVTTAPLSTFASRPLSIKAA